MKTDKHLSVFSHHYLKSIREASHMQMENTVPSFIIRITCISENAYEYLSYWAAIHEAPGWFDEILKGSFFLIRSVIKAPSAACPTAIGQAL